MRHQNLELHSAHKLSALHLAIHRVCCGFGLASNGLKHATIKMYTGFCAAEFLFCILLPTRLTPESGNFAATARCSAAARFSGNVLVVLCA